MRSIMEEHKKSGVQVVEVDDGIIVEHNGEEVASFTGKDPEVAASAHTWADGYAEAIIIN